MSESSKKIPLPWLLLATWGGCGLSPKAPGTVGTLGSLVLWAPVVLFDVPWLVRLLLVVVVFGVGVLASNAAVAVRGEDPQLVVIDEAAGMGLSVLLAPASPWSLLAGFVFFRLFDITKPFPVSWADQQVGGGLGVMLDDIVAGLYALGCVQLLVHFVLPHLPTLG